MPFYPRPFTHPAFSPRLFTPDFLPSPFSPRFFNPSINSMFLINMMEFHLRVKKRAVLSFVAVIDLVPVYESLATTLLADEHALLHFYEQHGLSYRSRTRNGPHIHTSYVESPGTQFKPGQQTAWRHITSHVMH